MAVNYTPNYENINGNFKTLKPFRFWCQKVLPLVYNDSLSYYELLNKVVDYLNNTIENVKLLNDNVNTLDENVRNIFDAYNALQNYVNNYFDNLDVQEEINNKLDAMVVDGTLNNLINTIAVPLIPGLVEEWLEENIEPTTPIVDATLSISGAAADAKVTGDAVKSLDDNVEAVSRGLIKFDSVVDEYVAQTGVFAYESGWTRTGYIDCTDFDSICVDTPIRSIYNCFYDANKAKVEAFTIEVGKHIYPIPNNTKYFAISNETDSFNNTKVYCAIGVKIEIINDVLNKNEYKLNGVLNIKPLIADYYVNTNGGISYTSGWSATDFIAIDDGVKYLYTSSPSRSSYNSFYDVNKGHTKNFAVPVGDGVIPIPETAKYFRMSNTTADMNSLVIYSYLRSSILTESTSEGVDLSSGFSGNIISLNPGMKAEILQAKTGYLTLIHLSDIHINTASLGNLRDVVKFLDKYNALIDGAVCTGDMQTQKFSDTYYDTVWDANGGGEIMTCIGNHDCTEGGDAYGRVEHTQAEVYNKFIEPYVTGENPLWGTVNYQTDITYWYKDYADKRTRLISMNSMLTDTEATTQNTWLQGVLSDAKTNNYSVIIMTHYGPYNGIKIECNFTDIDQPVISGFNSIYQQSVQDFIDEGGDFVCYLSGHTHYDLICKNSNFPEQLFVVVASTHADYAEDTKPYNRFNVITFDKTNHVVKIMRVGGDRNKYMRHIGLITIDYKTLNVIYSE